MAAQRTPGPLGSAGTAGPLDRGTLQVCTTPPPGPHLASRVNGTAHKVAAKQSNGGPEPADAPKPAPAPEDQVLEAMPDRTRDFVFAGRTLRLIRRRDWRAVQRDERYQVVPADDARSILQNLASVTVSRAEKAALEKAIPMLPAYGLSSRGEILLLRVTPLRHSTSSSSAPAMTPSQIVRSRERHWIEIKLVDEEGGAVPGIDYLIVTPDNQKHSGVTGQDGVARLEDIPPGQCKISFPKLDRDAWRAA